MHLRFLIAVPRRLPPVTFTHRSYRGQRTAEDSFWPEYFTFVCAPCIGEEHKTSLDVMRELFEHCTQSQPEAARLILPLVELHDPTTGHRQKLTGREIVTLPTPGPNIPDVLHQITPTIKSGLELHGITFPADQPVSPSAPASPAASEAPPEVINLPDLWYDPQTRSCHPAMHPCKEHPTAPIFITLTDHLTRLDLFCADCDAAGKEQTRTFDVALSGIQNKPAPIPPEGSGDTPVPSESVPSASPPSDSPTANAPQEPATSLLSNVRAILATEGKQQAKTLATRLGVPLDDIRTLVADPASHLLNKGGWIQPA